MSHLMLRRSFIALLKLPVCSITGITYKFLRKPGGIVSLQRHFHRSSTLLVKQFKDTENEYFHGVLEKLPQYSSVTRHPSKDDDQNISSVSLKKIKGKASKVPGIQPLEAFKELSYSEARKDLENTSLTNLIKTLVASLPQATDDQLQETLKHLCMWDPTESTRTPNFMTLWNALDSECSKRSGNWTPQKQLLVADYWFHLRLSRITVYNAHVLKNLGSKLYTLSPSQVVQYVFFSNMQRKFDPQVALVIEETLLDILPDLSVQEIGIICQSLFKCQKPIRSIPLIKNIFQAAFNFLPEIDSFTMGSIIKIIHYSYHRVRQNEPTYICGISNLLSSSSKYISNWSTSVSLHLLYLGVTAHIYDKRLLDNVIRNISLSELRLKELAKLLHIIVNFNHSVKDPDKFYKDVLQELDKEARNEEFQRYHHCLISSLWCLTFFNIYPENLLNRAFSSFQIDKRFKNYTFDLFALSKTLEIEFPDYNGHKLPDTLLQKCYHQLSASAVANSVQERITKKVFEFVCSMIGDPELCVLTSVLPHFWKQDIVLAKMKDSFIKPPVEIKPGYIVKPSTDLHWFCIVIHGPTSYCHDSSHLMGLSILKVRQLQKLGYDVIEIPYLLFSSADRYDIMKETERRLFQVKAAQKQ